MSKADLILTNGKVFTLWDERPWVSALAVGNGRILAAGDEMEVMGFRGPGTQVMDLGGKTVIPGLTDSHNHLLHYGQSAMLWASLDGCRSIEELLDRLRAHDRERNDAWILGIGFDHEIFAERRMPARDDLDKVSTEKPIFVVRLCGHACVANSKAIEIAGPERLPESGRKTGLLTEDDQGPVWEKVPDPSFEQLVEAARFAADKARSTGITCVHALVNSMDEFNAFKKLYDDGELPIRLYMQPSLGMIDALMEQGWTSGKGDDMFRVGTAKIFADGSMGARTAALVEEYTDDPGNKGWLLHTDEAMTEMVRKAHRAGWQAAIHAIGDKAIEQVVESIATALAETGESNLDRRHRVEHASILSESLVRRMAELRVFAAVQPQFVITDFWTVEHVGPERYRWTYPFKTMLESGIPTSFGSDCPVEHLDAFELIYRAVTRDACSKNECLSVEETIRVYAQGGPYFAFAEDRQGSLKPGMLADLVVLDRDIFTIPVEEIPHLKAEMVLVGGR